MKQQQQHSADVAAAAAAEDNYQHTLEVDFGPIQRCDGRLGNCTSNGSGSKGRDNLVVSRNLATNQL